MVSMDHFKYELLSQFRVADADSARTLSVTSDDLCKSVRNGSASMDACCEAMQQELQPSDEIVQGKDSGAGMHVRYHLPRSRR